MSKKFVAFILYDKNVPDEVGTGEAEVLMGYQNITCCIICDVKMDFPWKTQFIASIQQLRHQHLTLITLW